MTDAPRYVILHHQLPADAQRQTHWDLMLQQNGALATWAIVQAPAADVVIAAERLADHRCEYLTYEGPVSGDRGSVTRWDEGRYQWLQRDRGDLRIELDGRRLQGIVELRCRPDSAGGDWTFYFRSSRSSG